MTDLDVSIGTFWNLVLSLVVAIAAAILALEGTIATQGISMCAGQSVTTNSSEHLQLVTILGYVLFYIVVMIVTLNGVFVWTGTSPRLRAPEEIGALYQFLIVFALTPWFTKAIDSAVQCESGRGLVLAILSGVELVLFIVDGVLRVNA